MEKSKQDNPSSRIVILSNVYDDQYHSIRSESVARCLSSPKRRDLFHCLELATEKEVIVLSSPPKAEKQTSSRWLPAQATKFSTYRQFFCSNWDTPKIRIPLSWVFYAKHVLMHTRDGDILLIDNYELIYVIAGLIARFFRKVTIILDYEDGKHLIDQGWDRIISGLAELLCRPFLDGALVAHPGLSSRLPDYLPKLLVPGIVVSLQLSVKDMLPVRFLYSGSLDEARGVYLLLKTLELLPESGWHLDITGKGLLELEIERFISAGKYGSRVAYHGALNHLKYEQLIARCHVGLNCQRRADPISDVTFPSKIFSYLSAGLTVLSSRASAVPLICGTALLYFEQETPESLARAMKAIIDDPVGELAKADTKKALDLFSMEQSALRLREFFNKVSDLKR
jgi:glycosyltransferase involved in cell wall biosynthesis